MHQITDEEKDKGMNNISFTYADLTRHVERAVGAFMTQAKGSKDERVRKAFENQAKGVLVAWASLVYKPVIAQGDAAHEAHRQDHARMLDGVGLTDLAADIRSRAAQ